tara:strand:- start:277 stop:471 length:195 start_codon:yes stop_codon:yes gene_type:complete
MKSCFTSLLILKIFSHMLIYTTHPYGQQSFALLLWAFFNPVFTWLITKDRFLVICILLIIKALK